MYKINSIWLEAFKNKTHWSYNEMVKQALTLFALIGGTYKQFIKAYLDAFEKEDEVYQKYNRKLMTTDINSADDERDRIFRLMRELIRFYLKSTIEAKRRAAEILNGVLDLYGGGNIPTLAWSEESGALGNIVDDFTSKYAEQVEALSLTEVVQQLSAAEEQFQLSLQNRGEADAEQGKAAMVEARAKTDSMYRGMINVFNAALNIGDETLLPFAKYMNARIPYYRTLIGQGQPSSKPDGGEADGGGSEGSETEKKHRDLVFMVDGEELERVSCEVGKAIPQSKIPEAPEGKKWLGIPEVMPDEDVTVEAVPEEELPEPEDFTDEELREFPQLPEEYGSVEEITNPNSLLSPFNPLSINYKESNLLPGTPAPTEGPVPEGKTKVKFERESSEEEVERLRRLRREWKKAEKSERSEGSEETDSPEPPTTPFYLWYNLGQTLLDQGHLPEPLTGTHWSGLDHILDTDHFTVRQVLNEGGTEGDENEGGDNTNPGETTEPDHVRAFFIFANGEEETISGLPGSPMQPPINTVGYMWQPAPPRIIPTKDTTYREVVYVDDWK